MDRLSRLLLIPAGIATTAGIGLDMTTNMLQPYWPDAPHWLFATLFWSGPALILPLPSWLVWLIWKTRKALNSRQIVAGGFAVASTCYVGGIIWLWIIAAGGMTVQTQAHPASVASKTFPGFGAYIIVSLEDAKIVRKKYIFEFLTPEGASAAFYISASDRFTLTIKDVRGDIYPLEARVAIDAIPLHEMIYLAGEMGIDKDSTFLRILLDGEEVARRSIPGQIDAGSRQWVKGGGTFGADAEGKNNGSFTLGEVVVTNRTLDDQDLEHMKYYLHEKWNLTNR
jgi:hypothetical protein